MRKLLFALTIASLLVISAPLAAQTIYLPFVASDSIDAGSVSTTVWVANPDDQGRRYSTYFIPGEQSGGAERGDLPQTNVAPGQTRLVDFDRGNATLGVLELTGAPQLRYSAMLVTSDDRGNTISSTPLPLISSESLIQGGETVEVLGLRRRPGNDVTGFGLFNVSQEENSCQVGFYRAQGREIAPVALLNLAPLSLRFFDDVLGLLGEDAVADVRFQVTCDEDFYAYGLNATAAGGVVFLPPAIEGASLLVPPGFEPPLPPGTVVFEENGTFLNAQPGASRAAFSLPAEPGLVYDRITVEFDFAFARFTNPLFHTLSSMRGDGGLFYVVTLRGDRNKTILDSAGALGVGDNGSWQRGGNYRVKITMDGNQDRLFFEARRGGSVVQSFSSRLGRVLADFSGNGIVVDFSQDQVYDNAFFPLWGSRFSNLRVVMEAPEPN